MLPELSEDYLEVWAVFKQQTIDMALFALEVFQKLAELDKGRNLALRAIAPNYHIVLPGLQEWREQAFRLN
ncbi:MAG: hypothetical protein Fur0046_27780 [Cyanobacteria bacterium J069]